MPSLSIKQIFAEDPYSSDEKQKEQRQPCFIQLGEGKEVNNNTS